MKRPVLFFIINLHFIKSKKRLIIPLPLFLVEMIAQGAIVWKPIIKLIANSKRYTKLENQIARHVNINIEMKYIFEMLSELWLEFRALGKFEFIDIETGDIKIKIYTY